MNFKSKLAKFFYGRYGTDQLYNALFVCQIICLFLGAVTSLLGQITPVLAVVSVVLYALGVGLFVWTLFRCLSRNIPARRRENQAYLNLKAKLKPAPKRPKDTATHIFRSCPRCKATLRLPRQKGEHTVKCPKCGERFGVRVKG